MAYEPTNWKNGDVVTSAKLNKIEQGILGVSRVVNITDGDPYSADMSLEDAAAVVESGERLLCNIYTDSYAGAGYFMAADDFLFAACTVADWSAEQPTIITVMCYYGSEGVAIVPMGGGGGVLTVVGDLDEGRADKNANEIIQAIAAHQYPVLFDTSMEGAIATFCLVDWGNTDEDNKVMFSTYDATIYYVLANGDLTMD